MPANPLGPPRPIPPHLLPIPLASFRSRSNWAYLSISLALLSCSFRAHVPLYKYNILTFFSFVFGVCSFCRFCVFATSKVTAATQLQESRTRFTRTRRGWEWKVQRRVQSVRDCSSRNGTLVGLGRSVARPVGCLICLSCYWGKLYNVKGNILGSCTVKFRIRTIDISCCHRR